MMYARQNIVPCMGWNVVHIHTPCNSLVKRANHSSLALSFVSQVFCHTTAAKMAHYIDGKDCMVSRCHRKHHMIHPKTTTLTSRDVTDLGMDPPDFRIPVRCCAHVHASVSPPFEVGRVGLPIDCICAGCFGTDHLRHAHIQDGRFGQL